MKYAEKDSEPRSTPIILKSFTQARTNGLTDFLITDAPGTGLRGSCSRGMTNTRIREENEEGGKIRDRKKVRMSGGSAT